MSQKNRKTSDTGFCSSLPCKILWTLLEQSTRGIQKYREQNKEIMAMHQTLNPRDDLDKFYMTSKQGQRIIESIEDYVDWPIHRHILCGNKSKESLLTAASKCNCNRKNENLKNKNRNGFKLKRKKPKIPRTNNYGNGLRRWHGVSSKCTRRSRNSAA